MKKTLTMIAALLAFAAVAGQYQTIPLISGGGTNSVMTNNAVGSAIMQRPVIVPASTFGFTVSYKPTAHATNSVGTTNDFTCALQKSYDGTNDWVPVLTFAVTAVTNSTRTGYTNATIADYGYVRCLVTNAVGDTVSNVVLKIWHK